MCSHFYSFFFQNDSLQHIVTSFLFLLKNLSCQQKDAKLGNNLILSGSLMNSHTKRR
ncbi:hypothetical protein HanPSC8_Chr11g0490711 [Helianthus annuus]|nr:hypothetical protein HanPSC8_Chr11g0490711 [Helianthus annuus]